MGLLEFLWVTDRWADLIRVGKENVELSAVGGFEAAN